MHPRIRRMIVAAGAIASLSALTVGSVSAAGGQTVDIVGDQDLGASSGQPFYFKQGRVVVHQNDTVTWRNNTVAPHTISIIDRNEVPQSLTQTNACGFCDAFVTPHVPTFGPEGPVPPFAAALDNFSVSAAAPARLDSRGDSLVIAEKGVAYPSTLGGSIDSTVSAAITAPEGSVLSYVCIIHPWMQGEIQVLRRGAR